MGRTVHHSGNIHIQYEQRRGDRLPVFELKVGYTITLPDTGVSYDYIDCAVGCNCVVKKCDLIIPVCHVCKKERCRAMKG